MELLTSTTQNYNVILALMRTSTVRTKLQQKTESLLQKSFTRRSNWISNCGQRNISTHKVIIDKFRRDLLSNTLSNGNCNLPGARIDLSFILQDWSSFMRIILFSQLGTLQLTPLLKWNRESELIKLDLPSSEISSGLDLSKTLSWAVPLCHLQDLCLTFGSESYILPTHLSCDITISTMQPQFVYFVQVWGGVMAGEALVVTRVIAWAVTRLVTREPPEGRPRLGKYLLCDLIKPVNTPQTLDTSAFIAAGKHTGLAVYTI